MYEEVKIDEGLYY